ncbi:pentapeptide repeat-containing protein, partial [Lentibacter algarum]|uniref:pentapeptide repeat-containing protein n=1 Tax=Lentibacter algarum TaxID=576131 RepID=UPI001C073CBD
EGAYLFSARLEGANLFGARLEGADLRSACLEGANLDSARLEGASLRSARLEGADLRSARLEGANLDSARLYSSTNLTEALLRGASVRSVDDTTIRHLAPFLQDMFADGSVTLPKGTARPAHWPDWELPPLGEHNFYSEHQKWLADPDNYTPPPNPNPSD